MPSARSIRAVIGQILDFLFDRTPLRLSEGNGVVRYRVGYGGTDAEQILSVLSELTFEYGTDPVVRRHTTSIFDGIGNDDRQGQFTAITNFMADNIRYVRDPLGVEYVRSPIAMLREYDEFRIANGDCDDQVLLAGSMMHSVGFRVRPIGLKLNSADYFDHVAMQVMGDRGNIVTYDPCNPTNYFMEPRGDVMPGRWADEGK